MIGLVDLSRGVSYTTFSISTVQSFVFLTSRAKRPSHFSLGISQRIEPTFVVAEDVRTVEEVDPISFPLTL